MLALMREFISKQALPKTTEVRHGAMNASAADIARSFSRSHSHRINLHVL
jgi:hypothetical protein